MPWTVTRWGTSGDKPFGRLPKNKSSLALYLRRDEEQDRLYLAVEAASPDGLCVTLEKQGLSYKDYLDLAEFARRAASLVANHRPGEDKGTPPQLWRPGPEPAAADAAGEHEQPQHHGEKA